MNAKNGWQPYCTVTVTFLILSLTDDIAADSVVSLVVVITTATVAAANTTIFWLPRITDDIEENLGSPVNHTVQYAITLIKIKEKWNLPQTVLLGSTNAAYPRRETIKLTLSNSAGARLLMIAVNCNVEKGKKAPVVLARSICDDLNVVINRADLLDGETKNKKKT
ncbi:hypothetical protein GQX74_003444 [Glossina fuscipes]|nr:hypothetical protein GQX74_003444 [Glossina fuscipes]